jgi:hypothetical protein
MALQILSHDSIEEDEDDIDITWRARIYHSDITISAALFSIILIVTMLGNNVAVVW